MGVFWPNDMANTQPMQWPTAQQWFDLGKIRGGGEIQGRAYGAKECIIKCLEMDDTYSSAWCALGYGDGTKGSGGGVVIGIGSSYGSYHRQHECYMKALELDQLDGFAWYGLAGALEAIGLQRIVVSGQTYTVDECKAKDRALDR